MRSNAVSVIILKNLDLQEGGAQVVLKGSGIWKSFATLYKGLQVLLGSRSTMSGSREAVSTL